LTCPHIKPCNALNPITGNMLRFTIRLELYGLPTTEDYYKLHAAMEKIGFLRTLKGDKVYLLPDGEYNFDGINTGQGVLELAKSAANTIWKDYAVLVTSTEVTRDWYNLKEAK
jgi:hypothetical protein